MAPAASKIWLINIFLAAFIVFLGILSFEVWTQKDATIAEIRKDAADKISSPGKKINKRMMPPESIFEVVASKDLFSSDRAEYLAEDSKPQPPEISEKRIFLYGVVTLGGKTQALVSSPEFGPEAGGKGEKDKWVTVGDAIGHFKVAEIGKEKIILTEGVNRYEIFLHDEKKPARGIIVTGKSATPTVFSTGSQPAAAATSAGSGSARPASVSGSGAAEKKPAGEYEIVNTPFGPTKRRIK